MRVHGLDDMSSEDVDTDKKKNSPNQTLTEASCDVLGGNDIPFVSLGSGFALFAPHGRDAIDITVGSDYARVRRRCVIPRTRHLISSTHLSQVPLHADDNY